ncbi:ALP1-like protein [Tanacetum coccineum]
MLVTVVSYDVWIWHAFFGAAGANNDLAIPNYSPLSDNLLNDIAPVASFEANEVKFENGYYLADGIYLHGVRLSGGLAGVLHEVGVSGDWKLVGLVWCWVVGVVVGVRGGERVVVKGNRGGSGVEKALGCLDVGVQGSFRGEVSAVVYGWVVGCLRVIGLGVGVEGLASELAGRCEVSELVRKKVEGVGGVELLLGEEWMGLGRVGVGKVDVCEVEGGLRSLDTGISRSGGLACKEGGSGLELLGGDREVVGEGSGGRENVWGGRGVFKVGGEGV